MNIPSITIPGSIDKRRPPHSLDRSPPPPPSITHPADPPRYSQCPACGAQSYLWHEAYLCSDAAQCASVTPARAARRWL